MTLSDARQRFSAYGSGQLPEFELRSFIRAALRQEPQLSSAFVELTDAYRRANLIDAQLQSTINADIAEVTSPKGGPATLRRVGPDSPTAAATLVRLSVGQESHPGWTRDISSPDSTDPRSSTGPAVTGSTTGSMPDIAGALTDTATPLYRGSVLRDRFELVDELGRGGMGVVYKAYDRSRGDVKDRYVAIKVLNEEFKRHPLAVRTLQREARKAQKLAHPNVVAVYDFDRDGGNVFMVMEYMLGRSLDRVLREDGQGGIPLGPAMEIIKGLAAALSYAHEHGIVHCDFKPSNAFLTKERRVKVLDFGIARAAPLPAEKGDTTLFDPAQLGAVSPAYASFELLQNEKPDVRDDVYSFACVAYELLTGCHPYQRLDAVKAYQMDLQPRPVRKLSRRQWRALKRGLAFQRADRQPSIEALAAELLAKPRNTQLWVAAGSVAAAAICVAAILAWNWSRPQPLPAQNPPASTQPTSAAPTDKTPEQKPAALPDEPVPTPSSTVPMASTPASPAHQESPPEDTRGTTPPEQAVEQKRVAVEMLREQFETQAAAGDLPRAMATARTLARESPGSPYVSQEIPRILVQGYVHLAKTQFAGGEVIAALQTLEDGRKKFFRSPELQDLQVRYVAAANIYDRLSTAVVINVSDMKSALEGLRQSEGEEFETAAQMLAQTLADRIADQRAANRDSVADKLLESGKQLFPGYAEILVHGKPGVLQDNSLPPPDE